MCTLGDVAKELNVSVITIRRMVEAGTIKAVKIGKAWRVAREEVERIKKNGTR